MKKHLISVLFALVLSVVFFSVGAYAGEVETTKAEKWYNEGHAVSGMVMEVTIDDGSTEVVQTTYSKGTKAVSEIQIEGSTIRLITDSRDLTVFSPDFPIIHAKFSGMYDLFEEAFAAQVPESFSLIFVKEYQETVQDKEYSIEEFTDANGFVYKYYFLNDELDYIEAVSVAEEVEVTLLMDVILYEVDESVFDVPWYSINIAPVIMLFAFFSI